MLTGSQALEWTDWSKLHHAYGRATDTPNHLRALLNDDSEARKNALSHLWSAVIHQGTPWTATGPAALVVSGMMADERIDYGSLPVRRQLLTFLVSVASASTPSGWSTEQLERLAGYNIDHLIILDDEAALYEDEAAANAFFARSVLSCVAVTPILMKVMLDGFENASPRIRAAGSRRVHSKAKAILDNRLVPRGFEACLRQALEFLLPVSIVRSAADHFALHATMTQVGALVRSCPRTRRKFVRRPPTSWAISESGASRHQSWVDHPDIGLIIRIAAGAGRD